MQTYTFNVSGMHCASCKIFIEDALEGESGIHDVRVDGKHDTLSFNTTREERQEQLAESLTKKIEANGYSLSVNRKEKERSGVIWQALPIGLGLLALFFIIQKSGVLNFGLGGTVTPATSFIIGLMASVSSCLAIVGGLVLSLSATVSQDKISDIKPMTLFHLGRLGSFALFGGFLGAIGGAIGINFTLTAILGIAASVVMILLGLNLVGVLKRNVFSLSSRAFRFFRTFEHRTFAPLLLGIGTFFLPCGFTQAMQVAALSSGSFVSGFMIMTAFAFGTLPMLALLSFGSASFAQSKHAPLFFTSAGVLVIGLGTFALLSGLAGLGIIQPLFTL